MKRKIDWHQVAKFVAKGYRSMVVQMLAVILFTVGGMYLSLALVRAIYQAGGLSEFLGQAIAYQCVTTGRCDPVSLEFGLATTLIVGIQIVIMTAKLMVVAARVPEETREQMEDDALLDRIAHPSGAVQNDPATAGD